MEIPTPLAFTPDVLVAEYERIEALCAREGERPGRATTLGWDLEYTSPTALLAFIDQILFRRMNDFVAERDAPVIIDCGANIGYTTLHYKRQYPRARVIAFEPDLQFLPLLRANLQRNGASDVEVVEAAAWIADGEATWVMEGKDGSRLATETVAQKTTVVATADLRRYLQQDVDLLKLDIEGAEFVVVPHVADALDRVRNLVVECHVVDQTHYEGLARIITTLKAAGFQISVNSYGPWRDLTRRHIPEPLHAEQYLIVYGWRGEGVGVAAEWTQVPYTGIEHYRRSTGGAGLTRHNEDTGRTIAALIDRRRAAVVHRISRRFQQEQGHCWFLRLPQEFPHGDAGDELNSTAVVLEDGRLLGPGHAAHDDVRFKGAGLFSHWGRELYLSTSDNSDPNTNGRVYTIVALAPAVD